MRQTEFDRVSHVGRVLSGEDPMTCYHCGGVLKRGYSQRGHKRYCFGCYTELCDSENDDPSSGAKMLGSVMLATVVAVVFLVGGWLAWRYL